MKSKRSWRIFKKWKKKASQSTKSTEATTFKKQDLESRKEQLKYYKSIYDCKVENYFKCLETGDSRYLYYRKYWNDLPKEGLDDVFNNIFWEYQEESGLDHKLKMSIDYRAKILELKLKELNTGQNQKPFIARYETLLNGLKSKNKTQGLSSKLAILSKYMGYQVSPQLTLIEYIGIEKLYTEHAKSTNNK